MPETVRVRFAPSPTGFLHIGGVRTALFNWLFARHHQGKFILRIEDTDSSRSTEESIEEILASMRWLNLDWDEGPFRQTERQDLYRQMVDRLLTEGKAYQCYCTPEELEAKRKQAMEKGDKPKYDGTCRERTDTPENAPSVIRFKLPDEGTVNVEDLLRGTVSFDMGELDDLIIQRTDGSPTYNFVVVVDDMDMQITHVIRGDDHLSNTPRQALIYDALGFPRPKFMHISMILGPDKTRLSKRHGATSTLAYKDLGYLPEAMINYLARLGWSHGDQEIFTREEMVEHFSTDHITLSPAVFNQEKLVWLNQQYIKQSSPEHLAELLEPFLVKEGILEEGHNQDTQAIAAVIPALQERSKTLVEMATKTEFYFREAVEFDPKARDKFLKPEAKALLDKLAQEIDDLNQCTHDTVEQAFKKVVEEAGIKLGKLAQPVRVALTGKTESPGIYDVVLLLGKEKTLRRLETAIQSIDVS